MSGISSSGMSDWPLRRLEGLSAASPRSTKSSWAVPESSWMALTMVFGVMPWAWL